MSQTMVSGNTFWRLSGVTCVAGLSLVAERSVDDPSQQTVSHEIIYFMLVWLVLGFTDVLGFNTANLAHAGGLGVGLIQGWPGMVVKLSRKGVITDKDSW